MLLLLQLIPSASLGEALSKTAGRFPFRKLQKMHFLAAFTVAVSILCATRIPMEPLVYDISSSQKAKIHRVNYT